MLQRRHGSVRQIRRVFPHYRKVHFCVICKCWVTVVQWWVDSWRRNGTGGGVQTVYLSLVTVDQYCTCDDTTATDSFVLRWHKMHTIC